MTHPPHIEDKGYNRYLYYDDLSKEPSGEILLNVDSSEDVEEAFERLLKHFVVEVLCK
jgi:hypothetical protein